jgi:hypothetical protein
MSAPTITSYDVNAEPKSIAIQGEVSHVLKFTEDLLKVRKAFAAIADVELCIDWETIFDTSYYASSPEDFFSRLLKIITYGLIQDNES